MPAPFGTLVVRSVEHESDGSYTVKVGYAAAGLLGGPDPGMPPLPDPVKFPAGTKNIERLNDVRDGEIEVHAWLTNQGRDWESWNLKEYLEYRMQNLRG